jgi:hypothetical protein
MLKNILKKSFIILVELAIVAGSLWYIAQKKGYKNVSQMIPAVEQAITGKNQTPFPQLTDPVKKTYSWEYRGIKYSLSETLHGSVYGYYASQPKEYSYIGAGTAPADWEQDYYAMFLKSNAGDPTIANLADDIASQGRKHGLTGDQIVDLTMAFVQAIPYDDARARNILADSGNTAMQYPYETLYREMGVCSDKSLLSYALLRQMGYGVALFAYEKDNHMAIGIQCPKEYSTYGSGYCYAETTSVGNRIGVVPSFDQQTNKTVNAQLTEYDPNAIQQANLSQLGQVTMYDQIRGEQYSGIVETKKIKDRIADLNDKLISLSASLRNQKNTISEDENKQTEMKKNLDSLRRGGNIDSYNSMVVKYNAFIVTYKQDVKKFNDTVNLYNSTVKEYNSLLNQ